MQTIRSSAIVLNRINYKETDRIITVLTPDMGKLSLYVSGARSMKSKLASSIELFSLSDLSFIKSKGELFKLISGRVIKNYSHIITDYARIEVGYEMIKIINKYTYENTESVYFKLLELGLDSLDNVSFDPETIYLWFVLQLIAISGHSPDLSYQVNGQKLSQDDRFSFNLDNMHFYADQSGQYLPKDIKFLRLVLAVDKI